MKKEDAILNERSPLQSLAICYAVVAFGISFGALNRLQSWPSWLFFPTEPAAFLAFLFVVEVVPMALLFAVDFAVSRLVSARPLRLWRSGWLTLLIAAFLLPHAQPLLGALTMTVLLIGAAVVVAVWYRWIRAWAVYAGAAGVLLTGAFLIQTDFFSSIARMQERPVVPDNTLALPGPVLIIVFDEFSYDALLRDGRIDSDAFPNFAALAAEGVEFTNAVSNYAGSAHSFPSMLSGKLALPHWDRETTHRRNVLSTWALHTPVRAYEEIFHDCMVANGVCHHAYQGHPWHFALGASLFETKVVPPRLLPLGRRIFGADLGPYLFRDYYDAILSDLGASTAYRTVFFYHGFPPHYPFHLDADGNFTQVQYASFRDPKHFDEAWMNYRNTVRFLDKRIGGLVARLKELGLYDHATIVVTSDHGIRPHTHANASGIPDEVTWLTTRVPLIIKAPGLKPGRTDVEYQHIDFVPTLLDVLDMEWTEPLDGVSAFSQDRPKRERVFYYSIRRQPIPEERYVYDAHADSWQPAPQ